MAVRLPNKDANQVEADARAADRSTSDYIASKLKGRQLRQRPALAALGVLMQMHQAAKSGAQSGAVNAPVIAALIAQITGHACSEIDQ